VVVGIKIRTGKEEANHIASAAGLRGEMMFNVGDRVRVIDAAGFIENGLIGTIERILGEAAFVGRLYTYLHLPIPFHCSRLELVVDKPDNTPLPLPG
jgi:hypothetical protein